VAEEASFTKSARKLGLGKGTVSRAIASLERQLGAELVHRTTQAVALSTAGTALYERTAKHLSALDQAVQRLPERAEEPSGVLRLTAPNDFSFVVLPEVLAQFARRYPEVQVDLRV
jgi:DNA-binding transcriptional LysR family regulator